MKTNERFAWAASVMTINPSAHLLEIGCGAGLLVEQMLSYLESGIVTAVDRSEAMIKLANKRNEEAIANKRVKLITGEFAHLRFPKENFDIVTAFNVNFFWKSADKEMNLVKKILRPGGRLFIFHQAPFEITLKNVDPLKQNLEKYSFEVVDMILKKMQPTSSIAIHAKC